MIIPWLQHTFVVVACLYVYIAPTRHVDWYHLVSIFALSVHTITMFILLYPACYITTMLNGFDAVGMAVFCHVCNFALQLETIV